MLAIVLLAGCGTKTTQQPEPAPSKPDAGSVLLPPPKEGSDAKRFDFAPGGETSAAADTPAAGERAAASEEKAKLPDAAPITGTPASVPKELAPAATPPPAAKPTEPPVQEAPEPSAPVVPTPTMQEPPKAPASSATPSPTPKPAEQDLLTPPMAGGGK